MFGIKERSNYPNSGPKMVLKVEIKILWSRQVRNVIEGSGMFLL